MDATPRQLVRQTLEFAGPARVPRQLWLLPWASLHYPDEVAALQRRFPDDIVSCPSFLATSPAMQGDRHGGGTHVDEWGCTFVGLQAGIIGQVKAPLVSDWSHLERVRLPLECLSVDVAQVNAFCRGSDRFVLGGCCPRPFERLQFLRGSENLFMDLARRPAELEELVRRVHGFYVREFELWAGTDVDGLMMMDDWGAQRTMLIAPALWRRLFKPLYAEYCDIARRHGKYIFMHTDGYVLDILPDLVELGVHAVNCQVACMGIRTLGERFRGRITFWGEMDRQHLLPRGTPEDVALAVREMQAQLWSRGGVIAQCEFGPGARPENVRAVFETWEQAL